MTTYIPSLTLPPALFMNPYAAILTPIVGGSLIGLATNKLGHTQNTYLSLRRPPNYPPPWLFGPTWTVLYGLMGYASHRALTTGLSIGASPLQQQAAKHGATLYSIQLALNFLWMPLFFGLERPIEATVDILALGGTTAYLTYVWSKVDAVSSWCLVPYLGWLGFATYLCVGIGHLNDWDFGGKRTRRAPGDKTRIADPKKE